MRYSDWQSRLANFFKAAAVQPFDWGTHDCALFACNSILAITGRDPASHFRGEYTDMVGAYKALRDFAGGGLEETAIKICAEQGFQENQKNFEQRGDVGLCDQAGNDTLGIVDLTGRYVMIAAEHGMARLPMSCIKRSWRVE